MAGFSANVNSFASSFKPLYTENFFAYSGDRYKDFEIKTEAFTFHGSARLTDLDESSNIYTFEICGLINEGIGVNETLEAYYENGIYVIFSIRSNIKGFALFVPEKLFDEDVDLNESLNLNVGFVSGFAEPKLYLPSNLKDLSSSSFINNSIGIYINEIYY